MGEKKEKKMKTTFPIVLVIIFVDWLHSSQDQQRDVENPSH